MANMGSATGVPKGDDMQFWPLLLGNFSQAALLTYILLFGLVLGHSVMVLKPVRLSGF